MKNNSSKKIKILVIAIIFLLLIPSVIPFVKGVCIGYTSLDREIELSNEFGLDFKVFFVDIEPINDNIAAKSVGNNHRFIGYQDEGELFVAGKRSSVLWVLILRGLISFPMLILFICFFIALFRFAFKLSGHRIISEENIIRLNRIAYFLGAYSLAMYLIQISEVLWLRTHITLDGYRVVFPILPTELIVSLIILVMTEILKLGYQLQQEQELTI